MNKLYSRNAAIKYLKEQTGNMSLRIFVAEVEAGRIPEKPYGKGVRFRKEDLDRWQTITHMHHTNLSKETESGTRVSRSSLMDEGLSFANLLARGKFRSRKIGA